jgi:hypothetical protein
LYKIEKQQPKCNKKKAAHQGGLFFFTLILFRDDDLFGKRSPLLINEAHQVTPGRISVSPQFNEFAAGNIF